MSAHCQHCQKHQLDKNVHFHLLRSEVTTPDWIDEHTELWSSIEQPREIIDIVTAETWRERDGKSRWETPEIPPVVFLRSCVDCWQADPFCITPLLQEENLSRLDPPHTFLKELRYEEALKTQVQRQYFEMWRKFYERNSPPPTELGPPCTRCSKATEKGARFCCCCGEQIRLDA